MGDDETLLQDFYAGNRAALTTLFERHFESLRRIADGLLVARTGEVVQPGGFDSEDMVLDTLTYLAAAQSMGIDPWPHQLYSALTWLVLKLSMTIERALGLRPPF